MLCTCSIQFSLPKCLTFQQSSTSRAGEMAQWLGALAALPENLSSITVPTWQLTIVCDSSSRASRLCRCTTCVPTPWISEEDVGAPGSRIKHSCELVQLCKCFELPDSSPALGCLLLTTCGPVRWLRVQAWQPELECQNSHEGDRRELIGWGNLNKNGLHRLVFECLAREWNYLEGLGVVTFWRKCVTGDGVWGFKKPLPSPESVCLSLCLCLSLPLCLWIRMELSAPAPAYHHAPCRDGNRDKPLTL